MKVSTGVSSTALIATVKPAFLDPEHDLVGAVIAVFGGADRLEDIAFEQVEDRDAAFLLDIGVAPQDGAFIELDVDDAVIFGHGATAGKLLTSRPSAVFTGLPPIILRLAEPHHDQPFRRHDDDILAEVADRRIGIGRALIGKQRRLVRLRLGTRLSQKCPP